MIVAAGAGDGQSEERLAEDVDLIVDAVDDVVLWVNGIVLVLAEPVECGRERRFDKLAVARKPFRRQQISGDVFPGKLIVRDILIEGANQVIAIAPGVGLVVVELMAIGFCVADQIHPVASPALAVMGRGQQPVDDTSEGIWAVVVEKRPDFLRLGRQTCQVKRHPPEECGTASRRPGAKSFELGEKEAIDGRCGGISRRRIRPFDRLERPESPGAVHLRVGREQGGDHRQTYKKWNTEGAHSD